MKEKLEQINFNLNKEMLEYLIKFNNLKKELIKLNNMNVLSDKKMIKKQNIENEMNKIRKTFIKKFRESNQEEIKNYLQIKDQC